MRIARYTLLVPFLALVPSCGGGGGGGGSDLEFDKKAGGKVLNSPTPVSGATITFTGASGTFTTTSSNTGTFQLGDIPDGTYDVTIQGRGVFDASGDPIPDKIDLFHPGVVVQDGVDLFSGRPVFLPERAPGLAVDTSGTGTALLPAGTVVASPGAGAALVFESATTVTFPGVDDTTLSLTRVPVAEIPFPLPDGLTTTDVIAIQPAGTTFSAPPKLLLANTSAIPAGTKDVALYAHDTGTADWVAFGTGKVSLDGTSIVSDAGLGPDEAGWVTALVPAFCTTTLTGTVRDSGGHRIRDARVTTVNGLTATTDALGNFTLPGVPLPNATFPVVVNILPTPNGGLAATDSTPMLGMCGGTTNFGNVVVPDEVVDRTRPGVQSTTPAKGAIDVADSTAPRATFDEAMSPGSLNATSVRLTAGGTPVSGAIGVQTTGGLSTVTFLPDAPLPLGAACVLTIGAGVLDRAGNRLGSDVTVAFTTAAATSGGTPSVSVTPAGTTALDPGATMHLTAAVLDAAGSPVSGAKPVWTSDAPAVATVDATGNVTARTPGSATITATFGAATDTGSITVNTPPIAAVDVTPATQDMAVGSSLSLVPQALDGLAAPLVGFGFQWSSDMPAVATVDAAGHVTAVSAGTATITCTEPGSGLLDTTTLTVIDPASIATVVVTPAVPAVGVGESLQLAAEALDGSDAPIPGVTFTWSSSNTDLVTVTQSGVVSGVLDGGATITATADGVAGKLGTADVTCFLEIPLIVTVLGGAQADDPVPGLRVLRHDVSTGAFLEERTTDDAGQASFGTIGAPRATVTVLRDDRGTLGRARLHTFANIPTGNLTVSDGATPPAATFDLTVNGVEGSVDRASVFTGGYREGDTFSAFAQVPSAVVPGVATRQRQPNGTVSLLAVTIDSMQGIPIAAGSLLDRNPATLDGVGQSVTVDVSGLRGVPFASTTATAATGGTVRRGGTLFDQHFGRPAEATSGTAYLAVPTGTDRYAFAFETAGTTMDPTWRSSRMVFSSLPSSIAVALPDVAIDAFARDPMTQSYSFTTSGADVSALDWAEVEQDYQDTAGNDVRWTVVFDPAESGLQVPQLPTDVTSLVPPPGISHGLNLLVVEGVAGFDAALAVGESFMGNYPQFAMGAQVDVGMARRTIHPVSFQIGGLWTGTVTIDDGSGPVAVVDGQRLEFDEGTLVTVVATADLLGTVGELTCPGGSAPTGVPESMCGFPVDGAATIFVVFDLL